MLLWQLGARFTISISSPIIFKKTLHQIVQGVQKNFSIRTGCKLQNELRAADLEGDENNKKMS